MGPGRLAACALVLAGCGRFGFDGTAPDAASDAAPLGPAPQSLTVPTFTATTLTFVDIPGSTIEIPAAPGVRFLILTSAQLESSVPTVAGVEARYLIDGVERGLGGTETSVPNRPGPWQHAEVLDGDANPHTLSYQLRDAAGGMSTIHNLSVVVIPLPADAVAYGRSDLAQDVVTATEFPLVPISLGPLSGDYTFFLVANASDGPTGSNCYVQWRGPSDEVWLLATQMPRDSWQSMFAFQRATVDDSDAVVTLYTNRGSAGPSQVRYVRAIAVRSDAFASVAFARDDVFNNSASMTPMFAAELDLTPDPAPASNYLVAASLRLDEDCSAGPDAERAVHVVTDQQTTTLVHATDNCAYQTTYGTVQLLSTKPANVKIGYSTLNGTPLDYAGSQVLVLGVQ